LDSINLKVSTTVLGTFALIRSHIRRTNLAGARIMAGFWLWLDTVSGATLVVTS